MEERAFASATRLAGEIRDRRIGCVELLDFFVARAERYNPALNAIVAWQVDEARERAREADAALARGEVWGPLHGVPMTVKESFNVAGLPTTWGNPAWKDSIAGENAVLVERLHKAGAVIYGKTNVPLMLQASWRVELAPPRHRRLSDFRVGVWTRSPVSEIDASVQERFTAAATALRQAGASVDENSRPPFDDSEHQRLFMTLLRAATASR